MVGDVDRSNPGREGPGRVGRAHDPLEDQRQPGLLAKPLEVGPGEISLVVIIAAEFLKVDRSLSLGPPVAAGLDQEVAAGGNGRVDGDTDSGEARLLDDLDDTTQPGAVAKYVELIEMMAGVDRGDVPPQRRGLIATEAGGAGSGGAPGNLNSAVDVIHGGRRHRCHQHW